MNATWRLLAILILGGAGCRSVPTGPAPGTHVPSQAPVAVAKEDVTDLPGIGGNVKQGTLDGFDHEVGVAIGSKMAEQLMREDDKRPRVVIDANGHEKKKIEALRAIIKTWQAREFFPTVFKENITNLDAKFFNRLKTISGKPWRKNRQALCA